ncbi:uncharacterized protein LOC116293705 isoform X2 [Actinia tenebrosa]|uniref:Uncharacterized protein LOC116293705 isoform X2 n=1 Tax=Actinia tenebrosa TaxID=6105 RepID=A0A6P8HWR7_ACTTE|nr:uncharacterized protein LOC116293705 isoform X2 [Actinia tenebrosa]
MAGTGASSHKIFLPPSLIPAAGTPKTLTLPSAGGSFNLGDGQKRWLVTGICLNKILLPALRGFVGTEMIKHYTHLRTTHSIDKQSPSKYLKTDKKYMLNYASINNTEAKHKKKVHLYDYSIKSEVDLAKLYLQPYMAKFTGKDDFSVFYLFC